MFILWILFFFHISLSFNVLKLCPLVNTLLEDAILWNLRAEEPEYVSHYWYILLLLYNNEIDAIPTIYLILSIYLYYLWRTIDRAEEALPHERPKQYFYVDSFKFSSILSNLLQFLNITDTYTLFILNPKHPLAKDQVYGYR